MDKEIMELEQVKGNTWILKAWELIPLYRLDDRRCVLLDTGLVEEQDYLDRSLARHGLEPVGILCTHAHIDHMGNNAFLKGKYGTQLAMSLAEAGILSSYLTLNVSNYLFSPEDMRASPAHRGTPVVADRIILPGERSIDFCGAVFGIVPTPGHTSGHICITTPDNVLYLGDALMTGKTLHHSKFPYAFSMKEYMDSMTMLRTWPAEKFIAAHFGVYEEILPLVDMELRFLRERMLDLLDLVGDYTTPKRMAAAICDRYRIHPRRLSDMGYFEMSALSFINYLRGLGHLEACIENDQLIYRRTEASLEQETYRKTAILPRPGQFRDQ